MSIQKRSADSATLLRTPTVLRNYANGRMDSNSTKYLTQTICWPKEVYIITGGPSKYKLIDSDAVYSPIKEKIVFKHRKANGVYEQYCCDSILLLKEEFVDGKEDGLFTVYDYVYDWDKKRMTQYISSIISFKQGKLHGYWIHFHHSLDMNFPFVRGVAIFRNGKKKSSVYYKAFGEGIDFQKRDHFVAFPCYKHQIVME